MTRETSIATTLGIAAALTLCFLITYQAPSYSGEFSIILKLNNTKVLSEEDIIQYNATSHEFTLTSDCEERLKPMGWRLSGNFTMMVDGEVVLRGIFVPPIVSRSYPSTQVVIVYPNIWNSMGLMIYGVMKIQMGYPWDQPIGPDPRDDPRIVEYFERSGRLIK